MAFFFRFVYAKICCSYCDYVKQRNRRRRLKTITQMNAASFAALASKSQENAQTGSAAAASSTESAKKKEEEAGKNSTSRPNETAEIIDLFEESPSVDYKKITVPISITLFILSSYIIAGGVLFKMLEGWSILDGVYFWWESLFPLFLSIHQYLIFFKYWVLSIHKVSYSILYLDTLFFPSIQVKYRVGYLKKSSIQVEYQVCYLMDTQNSILVKNQELMYDISQ